MFSSIPVSCWYIPPGPASQQALVWFGRVTGGDSSSRQRCGLWQTGDFSWPPLRVSCLVMQAAMMPGHTFLQSPAWTAGAASCSRKAGGSLPDLSSPASRWICSTSFPVVSPFLRCLAWFPFSLPKPWMKQSLGALSPQENLLKDLFLMKYNSGKWGSGLGTETPW